MTSAGSAVPSPCTSVCRIDPRTGWCEGCARTLDEIAAWGTLPDAAKLLIWDALVGRRSALAQASASTSDEDMPR
jgi:predicted Fe-S protein YdhL (DUF1289 family)